MTFFPGLKSLQRLTSDLKRYSAANCDVVTRDAFDALYRKTHHESTFWAPETIEVFHVPRLTALVAQEGINRLTRSVLDTFWTTFLIGLPPELARAYVSLVPPLHDGRRILTSQCQSTPSSASSSSSLSDASRGMVSASGSTSASPISSADHISSDSSSDSESSDSSSVADE